MTDLTDFSEAWRLTSLLAATNYEPQPPDLANENEQLRSEISRLESALEDAKADIRSLRSLLGIVVHDLLGGEITLSPEQMETHPYRTHGIAASAQTVTGELVLRTARG